MVCLAPRAPGDSLRPRRLAGVVVRPLNFTVRRARNLFSKYAKVFVIVCLALAVIAPWFLPRRGRSGDSGSGDSDPGGGWVSDHHGGHDGGHAGGDGGGSH